MKHMINVLLAVVAACVSLRGVSGNSAVVQGVDNTEQFALLCRIYSVAKNPPINYVDLHEPVQIVKEINTVNSSLADEKQSNETEHMWNDSDAQVTPVTTRQAAVAQALLRRVSRKAHRILEEIKKMNITEEIEKVKTQFAHVIFGDDGNESDLCHGPLGDVTAREDTCGATGLQAKGKSAGNNLVVDFFCLCTLRTDDGIDNACGLKVGSKSSKPEKHGWGDAGPMGSSSMWATIKNGCANLLHQHPKSTEEGQDVLTDFLKHLKSGGVFRWDSGKKSYRKAGMLGTSACNKGGDGKGPVCDGKKGNNLPGGICVYYGQESEWNDIAWLKKIKTALNEVDALNNKTATIQRDIEKLHMLLHHAEKIYETAKVITNTQNPVLPTNLPTATKRLTAHNAAWRLRPHTHFISLFVLLS